MSAWYNPLGLADMAIVGDEVITQWRLQTFTDPRTEDRLIRENVRLAWELAPTLAVHLPGRSVCNQNLGV